MYLLKKSVIYALGLEQQKLWHIFIVIIHIYKNFLVKY